MIPARLKLKMYQGDTYYGPLITLPDLTSFDGPANLSGATVTAQVRDADDTLLGTFTVITVDATARQVRPTMAPVGTAALPVTSEQYKGYWDLQVSASGWVGTPLRGEVEILQEITHS